MKSEQRQNKKKLVTTNIQTSGIENYGDSNIRDDCKLLITYQELKTILLFDKALD